MKSFRGAIPKQISSSRLFISCKKSHSFYNFKSTNFNIN